MTGNSVALTFLRILTDTGTECHRTNQGQYTTHAMYDGRACKVMEHITKGSHHKAVGSIVTEPTSTPCPVSLNGIDEQGDHSTIDQIHRELGTLGHGTTDDGSRGGTEHGLEDQETLYGQITFIEREVAPVGHTDKACSLATEHKTESEEEEQERAEHKVDKVLHQDVSRVLTTGESRFAQGESWLHPENQHGCQ